MQNKEVKTFLENAKSFVKNKNFSQALELYRKVEQQMPEDPHVQADIARMYLWLDKPEEAIPSCLKAIKYSSEAKYDLFRFYFLHGRALIRMGKYKESIVEYEKSVHLKPCWLNFFDLACAYSLDNQIEKSLDTIKMSLTLNNTRVEDAKKDEDFKNISTSDDFQKMIEKVRAQVPSCDYSIWGFKSHYKEIGLKLLEKNYILFPKENLQSEDFLQALLFFTEKHITQLSEAKKVAAILRKSIAYGSDKEKIVKLLLSLHQKSDPLENHVKIRMVKKIVENVFDKNDTFAYRFADRFFSIIDTFIELAPLEGKDKIGWTLHEFYDYLAGLSELEEAKKRLLIRKMIIGVTKHPAYIGLHSYVRKNIKIKTKEGLDLLCNLLKTMLDRATNIYLDDPQAHYITRIFCEGFRCFVELGSDAKYLIDSFLSMLKEEEDLIHFLTIISHEFVINKQDLLSLANSEFVKVLFEKLHKPDKISQGQIRLRKFMVRLGYLEENILPENEKVIIPEKLPLTVEDINHFYKCLQLVEDDIKLGSKLSKEELARTYKQLPSDIENFYLQYNGIGEEISPVEEHNEILSEIKEKIEQVGKMESSVESYNFSDSSIIPVGISMVENEYYFIDTKKLSHHNYNPVLKISENGNRKVSVAGHSLTEFASRLMLKSWEDKEGFSIASIQLEDNIETRIKDA